MAVIPTASGSPRGLALLEDADRSLRDGSAAKAGGLAEQGWAAVRTAGPADPDFLRGVETASRILAALGQELRAEAIYNEAEAACHTPGLQIVKLRLQYLHARDLIKSLLYVKAETVLRSSVATEESMAHKSPLYVAFLQTLAFVREQEGDLDDAEALYRRTIGYARPDLSGVVSQVILYGKLPVPFIGDPRTSMAVFYTNHGRLKEAESLYREQLARSLHNEEEHLAALQQLDDFLSSHGSKTEAVEIAQQIVQRRQAHDLADPESRPFLEAARYSLANLEVAAGRGEDAKILLERALQQAALQSGESSLEYRNALSNLLENRRIAGDYDAAEKAAREALRRVEENPASEPADHAAAFFRLADIRRTQGHLEEADALNQQGVHVNLQAFPQGPPAHTGEFQNAETLVRMGKPAEAVRVAREIAASLNHPPWRTNSVFAISRSR